MDDKMTKQKTVSIIVSCILIIVAISAGIFYFGGDFFPNVKGQPVAVDTNATMESVSSLSDAMNNFSFELYHKLSSKNNENIFFSPYSIFVALAMTYEGARNETAEEMENILHFKQNDDTTLCSFGMIYNLLNQEKKYILNTANALWIKEDYPLLKKY